MEEVVLNPASLQNRSSSGDDGLSSTRGGPKRVLLPAEKSMERNKHTKPTLDKSWGTAVIACGATFFSSAVHSASGFFSVEFMRAYGFNRERASWPGSIFLAMDEAASIIVLGLLRAMSASAISKIGGVLLCSGIIASVFAPNLALISLTFGFIQGTGSGILSVTVTMILMMYFDKYRGVATGIRYAGYSLSSLLYPPILSMLVNVFTIKQVILIFGGISLHIAPFLLALKEPPWTRTPPDVKISSAKGRSKRCAVTENACELLEGNLTNTTGPQPDIVASAHKRGIESCNVLNGQILPYVENKNSMQNASEILEMSSCKIGTDLGPAALYGDNEYMHNTLRDVDCTCFNIKTKSKRNHHNTVVGMNLKSAAAQTCAGLKRKREIIAIISEPPLNGLPRISVYKKLLSRNSVYSLPIPQRSAQERTCGSGEQHMMSHLEEVWNSYDRDRSLDNVGTSTNSSGEDKNDQKRTLRYSRLLLTATFWAIVFGGVLADFTDCCLMATLVDSALDRGATRLQADLTIACLAPSQLLGRALLPLVADVGFVTRTSLSSVCYFLLACVFAVLANTRNFATYAPCAATASLLTGCLTTMKHVVAADYFGVGVVPAAWAATGTTLLPLLLCSPSIFGFFRDKQGSYDNFYYFLGSFNIVVGIIFLLLSASTMLKKKSWTVKRAEETTSGVNS